ncbi:hypothetical protein C5L30_000685 [Companilactobacillus farciminis]|uniref:DUF11 domain-containing protein n=1 Tax=Companilactobacillus farciminis TaxID=1612 RepID=A0A4R5NCQ1_9LACO|nr:isopeptide-forming domain-containing fimbrial protein [Companilactobacillus farciminis]ATO46876.1 hypothetical protein LF20184_08915 [Companilactobacillus farciminis KCTC 3681 = DSM 20184]TDG70908.1 hypothetical protein C5L30_000685 [Companilactobacillus farciminis]
MGKIQSIFKYIYIIFLGLFFILLTTLVRVNAAVDGNNDGIDDGVSRWSKGSVTRSDPIKLNSSLSLGYSFGLTTDANSNYTPNTSDNTMVKDSETNGSLNMYYSKMNIFLVSPSNKYISSTFQGFATSSNIASRKQGVSMTSPDFLITKPGVYSNVLSDTMSVLGNKMTDKSYYFHEDSDGKYTYMIAGNFKRDNYNFVVELLLRPSSTNRTLVQREMYVRNVSGSTQEFQVFFGEDTKMGLASSSYADAVPIKDLGNNHGIFIAAGDYKLSITNETEDGFQHYVALSRKTNAPNWADRYDSNGNGDEKRNLNYGETLLDSTDSAYSLSWDKTTLANNQVAHFSSTIGETQSPYSLMHANKTYKNETNNTGKNNINDKLKFTLNITNNGYNANWNYRQLVDKIPEGLQIDPNSIKKSFNNGTEVSINPSDYDASTRTLTVPIAQSLTDNQTEKVTFEANITTDAISHLDSSGNLKNTGQFFGTDQKVTGSTEETIDASVNIPVEKPSFSSTFTKQLKNESTDSEFKDSTEGKKGDVIDYLISYKVDSGSKDYLQSGATITDEIPAGLEVDESSVYVKGPKDTNYYYQGTHYHEGKLISTGMNAIEQGESVLIKFSATVTANSVGLITNTANITGGTTSGGQATGEMVSNGADLNIKNINGFIQVPSLINFGAVNLAGQQENLTNTSTNGELIVSHPDDNPFNVYVSYDNSKDGLQNSNGNKLSSDGAGLLFIKQKNNSSTNNGTWHPLSSEATPIRTASFQNTNQEENLNFTDYIGVGDWQLKLAPDTVPGAYNGKLTWTMVDDITTS